MTDFKPTLVDGESFLSFILQAEDLSTQTFKHVGIILNSRYELVQEIDFSSDFDVHEFVLLDKDLSSFLRICRPKYPAEVLGSNVHLLDTCPCEVDTQGNVLVKFCPSKWLNFTETFRKVPAADPL